MNLHSSSTIFRKPSCEMVRTMSNEVEPHLLVLTPKQNNAARKNLHCTHFERLPTFLWNVQVIFRAKYSRVLGCLGIFTSSWKLDNFGIQQPYCFPQFLIGNARSFSLNDLGQYDVTPKHAAAKKAPRRPLHTRAKAFDKSQTP